MGFAIRPHARDLPDTQSRHAQTNVVSPDDKRERIAIRQDSPRRELSGRVLDHSSASSGADSCVLQFRQDCDDIADHATLGERDKLSYLDSLEAELLGHGDSQPEAVNLRRALGERSMAPRHALDVLTAFRMDVTKLRYESWDEVIHYLPVIPPCRSDGSCSTSTARAHRPGPPRTRCARACKSNNHLQDCGKDYRNLNRVYLRVMRSPRMSFRRSARRGEGVGAAAKLPAFVGGAERGSAQ